MRMTNLFSTTLRDRPSEADIPSHELLLRAGFIRQLAAGIFSYLPLAKRSLTKIEDIMREEMNAINGQVGIRSARRWAGLKTSRTATWCWP
jgi:prolyl-tRNA synthetase